MSADPRQVKPPRDPTQANRAHLREQLGRIRAAVNAKSHWIVATGGFAAHAVRYQAALLVLVGYGPHIALADLDVQVLDRATVGPTVAAFPKAVLPADEMAGFVMRVTRRGPRVYQEALAGLQGG